MSGSSPLSRPRSASQTTSIAAPSLRPDALPAVTVPWNAGRKSRQRLGGRLRARMFVLLQLVHRHQLVAKMSSRLSRAATLLAARQNDPAPRAKSRIVPPAAPPSRPGVRR